METKGGITFNDVFFQMSPNQIAEANAALDIYIEAVNKAAKAK